MVFGKLNSVKVSFLWEMKYSNISFKLEEVPNVNLVEEFSLPVARHLAFLQFYYSCTGNR